MSRVLNDHTLGSAWRRLNHLVRGLGPGRTVSVLCSALDDKYLRLFDRRYNISTSGFILLSNTSVDRSRLADATQYGPVNGWALRKFLRKLDLPKSRHFVDLGCGLGRACIIAADYGFQKATGVELAPEFCAMARENVARCRLPAEKKSAITILEQDALLYCQQTDADIFFMFRPFSQQFLEQVIERLAQRAVALRKPVTIIYSERMLLEKSYAETISASGAFRRVNDGGSFGQAFYVYRCGA